MNEPVRRAAGGRVFIAGESPLVEEYASACLAAGMGAAVMFNPGSGGKLPAGAVRGKTPGGRFTAGLELTNTSREAKRKNLAALDAGLPDGAPILSASAATTVAEQSTWIRRPERLIGIAALPTLLSGMLVELAPSAAAGAGAIEAARKFFTALGKEPSVVQDSPGMVLPRILCMLVNEASFALAERVARRGDIDTAMKLGTHYPFGPIEWGMTIGLGHVRAVLECLHREFGEERYRTAPLLARGLPETGESGGPARRAGHIQ
jgi:3-hydroxybutyryl-CoA dehydrogenase